MKRSAQPVRLFGLILLLLPGGCSKKTEPPTETSPVPQEIETAKTNEAPVTNTPVAVERLPAIPAEIAPPPVPPGQSLYEQALARLTDTNGPDPAGAARLLDQAQAAGNLQARHDLALLSLEGRGVEKDEKRGTELLQSAAEGGNADAQFRLASLHARGIGVPEDLKAAALWAAKAAEQGHAEAQYNLATLYVAGMGVETNATEAAKWFLKAAEGGHATAQSNVGVLYANGKTFDKNMEEAIRWWTKAAEQGQPTAQFNLAQALHEQSVPDYVEAYKWATLAAGRGDPEAARMRDEVALKMTPTQLREGLRRAAAFKPVVQTARK